MYYVPVARKLGIDDITTLMHICRILERRIGNDLEQINYLLNNIATHEQAASNKQNLGIGDGGTVRGNDKSQH